MVEFKGSVELESVKRNTLPKQVVDSIVQLLISGQLKPGDKLPSEMELIDMLGVSRPVLREALSSLEALEVITRKTRGGTHFNNKVGSNPFSVMLALSIETFSDNRSTNGFRIGTCGHGGRKDYKRAVKTIKGNH